MLILFFFIWKILAFYIGDITFEGIAHFGIKIQISPEEPRAEFVCHPQHIMGHQNLSVDPVTR